MKKLIISAAVLMSVTASFVACKKSDNSSVINNPTPGPYTSLFSAFSDLAPKSKTVSINATSGGSFYGNSGTRYEFQPNSFQTLSGAVVTGNVDIQVLECTNNADMIFAKMLTISDDQLLYSAGEISVNATQGGVPVYIRPGMSYKANMPTNTGASTSGMSFYKGVPTPDLPGSIVNWKLISGDSLNARLVYNGDTIVLTPDSLGMSNCDKLALVDFVHIDLKLDGISTTLKQSDFMAYFIPSNFLATYPLKMDSFGAGVCKSSKIIKQGSHIVLCAVYNGYFYGGILTNTSVTDGSTYTIKLSQTTPSAFKALINALK